MRSVVGYLWGLERLDIVVAANELTENVASLEVVAPSDIANLSPAHRAALIHFGKIRAGIMTQVKPTGHGYVLFCEWMEKLHDYAKYTD